LPTIVGLGEIIGLENGWHASYAPIFLRGRERQAE